MSMASLYAAAAAAGDGAEHAKGGLPQLNIETFPSQIFWLVVTLVVLFYLLSKIALPPGATGIMHLHVQVDSEPGNYVITSDIHSGGMEFREWVEALVTVK